MGSGEEERAAEEEEEGEGDDGGKRTASERKNRWESFRCLSRRKRDG